MLLAEALQRGGGSAGVHLIDISSQALEQTEQRLTRCGTSSVVGHRSTYEEGLRRAVAARRAGSTMLVLLLGSNIGNFDRPAAGAVPRPYSRDARAWRSAAARRRSRQARARSAPRLRRSARRDGGVQQEPARPHQPRAWRRFRSDGLRAPGGVERRESADRDAPGEPHRPARRDLAAAMWGAVCRGRIDLDGELVQVHTRAAVAELGSVRVFRDRTVDRSGRPVRADVVRSVNDRCYRSAVCKPPRLASRLSVESMHDASCASGAVGGRRGRARVAAQPISAASAINSTVTSPRKSGRRPPRSGFHQRDPKDGADATFETEVRVAYDGNAIYIAVQAIDPEPSRIVGNLTRRDESSPSDWIRVMIDSFHDRRSAYEFAVNPAGRQGGHLLVQRHQQRPGLGRRVGRRGQPQRSRAGARSFAIPVLAAALPPDATATFGFAVVREIGRLNETTTWPLLAKSARLRVVVRRADRLADRSVAEAPRAGAVRGRRLTTQPVDDGQPLQDANERRRRSRRRSQVRRQAEPHAHRHGQPGLRPGRSRSGRGQPVGVRDVLLGAAAVLRRRLRHLPVRRRLQRRQLQRAVLLAPHRPRAAGRGRRSPTASTPTRRRRRRSSAPRS